ncbi:YchJ family protein [Aliikangiella coralliicola]|uniref:YchJ family protein n=1 Tax=Aliikangiella coralliicola TaxID=2592383 RepID=A0A545UGE3_9GAMM|nr:YchJ family protein [Aliikangiella coralliicola]TQV88546.1 YchJ family protein [Aliikangiella coralliicola]
MTNHCYCGNNGSFAQCCEPLIRTAKKPLTPEQLMRSRYSAYSTGNAQYLLDTLAPEKRQLDEKAKIQQTIDSTKWIGLKIVSTEFDDSKPNQGSVEFVAFYQENGIQQLHECSRFIKQDSHWFYLDGEHLPPIKIGRNDRCFCNSGKKYKKCHGN